MVDPQDTSSTSHEGDRERERDTVLYAWEYTNEGNRRRRGTETLFAHPLTGIKVRMHNKCEVSIIHFDNLYV